MGGRVHFKKPNCIFTTNVNEAVSFGIFHRKFRIFLLIEIFFLNETVFSEDLDCQQIEHLVKITLVFVEYILISTKPFFNSKIFSRKISSSSIR